MRRIALSLAFVALAAPAAVACAKGGGKTYFPLAHGNRWVFDTTTIGAARVRPGVFRLDGFPGATSLRVRWAGSALQAWDTRQRRWEPFLRLGAPKGTRYGVDLAPELWQDVRVTVATRNATVRVAPLERSVSRAVRLALRPNPGLADAGITSLVFAPGVGLVVWEETTLLGTVRHALSSARLGGRTLERS